MVAYQDSQSTFVFVPLQNAWLYPHIARRDAEEGVNASWLRQLNNSNYEFRRWADAVAGRLPAGVVGGLRGVGKPPPKGAGAAAMALGHSGTCMEALLWVRWVVVGREGCWQRRVRWNASKRWTKLINTLALSGVRGVPDFASCC